MNQPNRRDFLKVTGLAGLAALVKGCHDDKNDDTQMQQCNPVYSNLNFTNKEGIGYQLLLARCHDRVDVSAPNGNYRLHFYEAPDDQTHTIGLDEFIVLTNRTGTPLTHVLRYTKHDPVTCQVEFQDLGTGTRQSTYPCPVTPTGFGDLVVAGTTYKFRVDEATSKLLVDQTGDGLFNRMQAPIVDINDILTLEEDLLVP